MTARTPRHAKYTPPAPLEAPADLAALVADHLACPPGREWGRTLMSIQRWAIEHRVRMHQVFTVDGDVCVTLSDSLPKVGRRGMSNNNEGRWR